MSVRYLHWLLYLALHVPLAPQCSLTDSEADDKVQAEAACYRCGLRPSTGRVTMAGRQVLRASLPGPATHSDAFHVCWPGRRASRLPYDDVQLASSSTISGNQVVTAFGFA